MNKEQFITNELNKNKTILEATDNWLNYLWESSKCCECNCNPCKCNIDEEEEQIPSGTQTTSPLQPVNSDHQEEETDPKIKELKQHVDQVSSQNPNLGLKLDCVGTKTGGADNRVWYLFGNQAANTPAGKQAKKWGGYSTKEISNMTAELKKMNPQAIGSYFK